MSDHPLVRRHERASRFGAGGMLAQCFYAICRFIAVGASRLYYPGVVLHRSRLPKHGPYVLAPVHRSNVDWLIVARVTKRRLRYLVKEEVWKVSAAGKILEMLGSFPVDRNGADREAIANSLTVLEAGEPLVMFPEGTRQIGPTVGDLHEGASYIALRAAVPIVPVAFSSMERAMPRGARFPRPLWTKVVIGEPVLPKGVAGAANKRVARSAIRAHSEELRQALQITFDEAEPHHGGSG